MIRRSIVSLRGAEQVFGLTAAAARERVARLSRREAEVAALLAAGEHSRDIAAELGITLKTMDVHRFSIKAKLRADTLAQVANVVHLARLAESAP